MTTENMHITAKDQTEKAQHEIHFLTDSLNGNPQNSNNWALLAANYAEVREYQKAINCYENALRINPAFHIVRFQLGLLQLCLADFEASQQTWSDLGQLNESDPLRMFVAGIQCLMHDQFSDAVSWLEKGIEYNLHNQALTQDMGAMIERIKTIERTMRSDSVKSDVDSQESEGSTQHFLVSGYGKGH